MGFVFFQLQRQGDKILPSAQQWHFSTIFQVGCISPKFVKEISMVKVVHQSILDKIKKNQVNRCSRLQDLGA